MPFFLKIGIIKAFLNPLKGKEKGRQLDHQDLSPEKRNNQPGLPK